MLKKNLIRRRMSFFLLLMLYIGFCCEVAAFPPNVMAVGELHELDGGYWIEVVEADVEGGKALLVLGRLPDKALVSKAYVSRGEWFSLDDRDLFHFEAILNNVFHSEDAIMVELTEYDWWPRKETPPDPPDSLYLIFIISAGTIVLIFIIFARNRLNDRTRQQKIEEYRAKMHKLEKEGYDVSDLKGVLGDEK